MSTFQDLQVSGLLQANSIAGATISSTGDVLAQDNGGSIALATGNNDDVPIPSLRVPGATVFVFTCGGTAVLRSIAPELPSGELPPGNMVITIVNGNAIGGNLIQTGANVGGTAANRIALAVQLAAGAAMQMIYNRTLSRWLPLFPVAIPG